MPLTPAHWMFLNIKAAGPGPDAWPIEVGLAWIVYGRVHTWSSLIRPEPDWDPGVWSDQSATIHNIPRAELNTAPRAYDVAYDLFEWIAAHHVIHERSQFDHIWIARLMETIGVAPPELLRLDFVVAYASEGNVHVIKHVLAHMKETPQLHRAGADAARLAQAVLSGVEFERLLGGTSR